MVLVWCWCPFLARLINESTRKEKEFKFRFSKQSTCSRTYRTVLSLVAQSDPRLDQLTWHVSRSELRAVARDAGLRRIDGALHRCNQTCEVSTMPGQPLKRRFFFICAEAAFVYFVSLFVAVSSSPSSPFGALLFLFASFSSSAFCERRSYMRRMRSCLARSRTASEERCRRLGCRRQQKSSQGCRTLRLTKSS